MRVFDYIYYRVFRLYRTKWRTAVPEAYAISLVSLVQSLILLDAYLILKISGFSDPNFNGLIGFFAFIGLAGLNWLRYRGKYDYDMLKRKWGREPADKVILKGWGILFIFSIVIGLFFLLPS